MTRELAKLLRTHGLGGDWMGWKSDLERAALELSDLALSIQSCVDREGRDKAIEECVSACMRLQTVQLREPIA